jgi:hypothetical protein
MDVDTAHNDWPGRAACRWVIYVLLWIATVCLCMLASEHLVLQVGGALLGCLLAASLPLIFATLFETAYSRRSRQDLPLILCPCFGTVVVLIGVIALQQASPLVVWSISLETVDTASELGKKYSGVDPKRLPRAVCIQSAFMKTDWEAGKLECREKDGHVDCEEEFVAAPIFDDKSASDSGLAKDIYAWGVTRGRHMIAEYKPDGSLCGYLRGTADLDYYLGTFHVAIERVMDKYHLALDEQITSSTVGGTPAVASLMASTASSSTAPGTPLGTRPVLLIADPAKMLSKEQAWLIFALVLLGGCPCVGPLPLGLVFCFWCWARHDNMYSGGRRVGHGVDDDNERGSHSWAHIINQPLE